MGSLARGKSRINQSESVLVQSWFNYLDPQQLYERSPLDHCLPTHLKSHSIEALRGNIDNIERDAGLYL